MRQSFLSTVGLGFSALARATIIMPAANNQWPVVNRDITWDTGGLAPPLNRHLVPASAKNLTVIITDIALSVGNTGKFQGAPLSTINMEEVQIIIIDAAKKLVISEIFIIIIINTKTATKPLTQLGTATLLKTPSVTVLQKTSKSLALPVILQTTAPTKSLTLNSTAKATSTGSAAKATSGAFTGGASQASFSFMFALLSGGLVSLFVVMSQ